MEDIRYLQGYANGESSMCADFNAAFDLIADIWVDGPTDAATKYLGIKNLLKECYEMMNGFKDCCDSEFRISTDPPDMEHENLCKRIEAVIGVSNG